MTFRLLSTETEATFFAANLNAEAPHVDIRAIVDGIFDFLYEI